MALDRIGQKWGINIDKNKFNALVGEGIINGEKVMLVKPQTYMNLSGESLKQIVDFYKIDVQDVIVIYDDIDIELGAIRIKPRGGTGTHNGMRNIAMLLGKTDFPRVRIGTGKVVTGIDLKDFVLMKMTKDELALLEKVLENVYISVNEILVHGIEKAMSIYNNKNEVL